MSRALLVRTWTNTVLRSVICAPRASTRVVKALPVARRVGPEARRRTKEAQIVCHAGRARIQARTGGPVCRVKRVNTNLRLARSRVSRAMQASIKTAPVKARAKTAVQSKYQMWVRPGARDVLVDISSWA